MSSRTAPFTYVNSAQASLRIRELGAGDIEIVEVDAVPHDAANAQPRLPNISSAALDRAGKTSSSHAVARDGTITLNTPFPIGDTAIHTIYHPGYDRLMARVTLAQQQVAAVTSQPGGALKIMLSRKDFASVYEIVRSGRDFRWRCDLKVTATGQMVRREDSAGHI